MVVFLRNANGSALRSVSLKFLTGIEWRLLFQSLTQLALQFHSFLMSLVALVHPGQTVQVSHERLASQCELFNDPALFAAPYTVRSSVVLAIFRDFVRALNKETFELTNDNFDGLSLLCAEFGFRAFSANLSAFRASAAFRADTEARLRIAALEEWWLKRDHPSRLHRRRFDSIR
jgi:hypothetical protein